ncbi:hypothetical protein [Pseudomonas marginalis]|uniref:hypothetical protein n=1 Tax=Pseudomonas marginalis TaxID=298 RepID=UPI0020343DC1|nr:hypothetical protein [Pseudomonas marginalis]MCM2377839.1 hypothetical protein [Pseudomonas marginalis]
MDDEGDFKKARGFLLTYSALVLALWYFGADLTQFKLMGNEVQLHQRTNSVWLVLATINLYFWMRFYQRVPKLGLYFDGPMNEIYDQALVWIGVKLKRRELDKIARAEFAVHRDESGEMQINGHGGSATVHGVLEEQYRKDGDNTPELHEVTRATRTKLNLYAAYTFTENGEWRPFSGFGRLDYEPNAFLTWTVKAYAIVRGALVTPWFTDHIAPLILGGISTSIAVWKWFDMNFLATTLSQSALLCIK